MMNGPKTDKYTTGRQTTFHEITGIASSCEQPQFLKSWDSSGHCHVVKD
jgi:hypothetical protein